MHPEMLTTYPHAESSIGMRIAFDVHHIQWVHAFRAALCRRMQVSLFELIPAAGVRDAVKILEQYERDL